jgi:F-type H+-transporting ATPase subunit alpha
MTPIQTDLAAGNKGDNDWLVSSRAALARAQFAPQAETVGRVEHVSDGIASVSGLPDVRLNELLRFEGGRLGFALTLDADAIGAVLLDDGDAISAGSRVSGTGQVVEVPVGPGLLGRVVDPLGRPLDNGEPVAAEMHLPIERPAPSIIDRDLVEQPVATGILLIDALFAIGRGQRELIIGDRATGKTSIAIDTIVNQKHTDMICVYVAIGQRATAVQRVVDAVRRHGAPERCVFVVASAAASPGLQWIAPFSGFSIAEYFRDRGQHALIVIDDLSKHAATHRELSLLTREPPGREAYPGDIFYLHARLLERAAKLSKELGGGSLTALPVAETDAGNLSAYIPTNLISITDGQIMLDAALFAANQRPAVDVGLSVSRVGGKAQWPALRKVSGRLRLDYSQFLELEMFTRFGGAMEPRVKAQVVRGERIRALITQPRFAPLRPVDEIALLAALADGVFDEEPVGCIATVRTRLAAHLDAHGGPAASAALVATGTLDEATLSGLVAAVRDLAVQVSAATATEAVAEAEAEAKQETKPEATST